ncbi:MAG: hypothetical protein H7312_16165 [Tardiphaga sp.]|jgi:hypothetical protein|nr:hypothetical protein [Tardiphaga sp.]
MATGFDRDALLEAFDDIARAAVAAGTRLQIAVYGGSALMLASNFRFATEDVDIAEIGGDWPQWLREVAKKIATERGWGDDWLNEGVAFHLSALASPADDHLEFGTFPRDGSTPGLVVTVPTAEYLLAMKLKAMRVTDVVRGDTERLDILNLMQVVGIESVDQAITLLGKYFPVSAASPEKQRFLLKNMSREGKSDAPEYPR